MKESTSKRKEWVKNATIIFLVVLLILTFFSNTFMNYSLPEVATTYVQSGSITAKVRGTGNVEASDPYSVIAKESRVITSVAVEQGDVVEKDDILYYLEEAESEELKTAEAELDALVLEYMLSLFSGEASSSTINKVENGNIDSFSSMQAQIAAMQNSVTEAENSVAAQQTLIDNLNTQLELLKNNQTPDTTGETAAVTEAKESVISAQKEVDSDQLQVTELESQKETAVARLTALEAAGAGQSKASVEAIRDQAVIDRDAAKEYVTSTINGIIRTLDPGEATLDFDEALEEAKTYELLYQLITDFDDSKDSVEAYDSVVAKYNEAEAAVVSAQAAVDGWDTSQANYQSALTNLADIENKLKKEIDDLSDAQDDLYDAQEAQLTAEQILTDKENNITNANTQKEINDKLIEANAALAVAQTQLETVQADQTELITNLQAELNLDSKNDQIEEKEAEIEELKEKSAGSAITAPVAGTVTSLAHVAGETMKLDEEIAVIQVAGKGFTMSLSVTNEEAAKVAVGDNAELDNAWYYNDVQVILTSIRSDPDNPGRNRLLVFSVDGENIQNGQALSISVGQRSSDYELVVPKSAIREDSNGKFILTIEERGTPLGTRYIANRVDVEELASDDNNMAISGALYGYGEYVITTATKPVTAGQQVRLPD